MGIPELVIALVAVVIVVISVLGVTRRRRHGRARSPRSLSSASTTAPGVTTDAALCGECNGAGYLTTTVTGWRAHSFLGQIGAVTSATRKKKCSRCGGTGRLPA